MTIFWGGPDHPPRHRVVPFTSAGSCRNFGGGLSGLTASTSPARDQPQPGRQMKGAHQQVHRDHPGQWRRACDRTQRRSATKHGRQQRHDRKCRRGCEIEPISRACRCGAAAFTTDRAAATSFAHVVSPAMKCSCMPEGRSRAGRNACARAGLAHGFAPACLLRNAASPASDTSTHLLSGAAPST